MARFNHISLKPFELFVELKVNKGKSLVLGALRTLWKRRILYLLIEKPVVIQKIPDSSSYVLSDKIFTTDIEMRTNWVKVGFSLVR